MGESRDHHQDADPDRHGLSHYLATLALFNAAFGVAIGLGIWVIEVPYPMLWGVDPAHAQLACGTLRLALDNHLGVRVTAPTPVSDKIDELHTGLNVTPHLPPLGVTRAR